MTSPRALTEGYALVFRTGAGVLLAAALFMLFCLPKPERAPVPAPAA